jgi:hypothetical protein
MESKIFNCCKEFLQSIYGQKYVRRICSESEMSSILTLLWISFDAAQIQHDFKDKIELYQYLRESFKIKTPDAPTSPPTSDCVPDPVSTFIPHTLHDAVHDAAPDAVHDALPDALPDALSDAVPDPVFVESESLRDDPEETEVETVEKVEKVEKVENESPYVPIEVVVAPFIPRIGTSHGTNESAIVDPMTMSEGERTIGLEETEDINVNDMADVSSNLSTESIDADNEYSGGIHSRIAQLLAIPQPEQKSLAWLSQRQDYITASVFGASTGLLGPAALVNLLLDKVSRGKLNPFFGNQATHWGEKYEPLTNDIYCYRMQAKTYEFGMIPHPQPDLNFLGASTDGIAITKEGKLVNIEIKSPFSRYITGIPKPEYWAQMQLQMEILDLDETHFIESKFREYSLDEFWPLFEQSIEDIDDGVEPVCSSRLANGLRMRQPVFSSGLAGATQQRRPVEEPQYEYDAEGERLALCEASHAKIVSGLKPAKDALKSSTLDNDALKSSTLDSDALKSSTLDNEKKQSYIPGQQGMKGDQVRPERRIKREERGLMIEVIDLEKQENDGTPKRTYISSPVKYYKSQRKLREWQAKKMEELRNSETLVFLQCHAWVVERFSCVYVERDKVWFRNQIDVIKSFWSDVLKYRQTHPGNTEFEIMKIGALKDSLLAKYRLMLSSKSGLPSSSTSATKPSGVPTVRQSSLLANAIEIPINGGVTPLDAVPAVGFFKGGVTPLDAVPAVGFFKGGVTPLEETPLARTMKYKTLFRSDLALAGSHNSGRGQSYSATKLPYAGGSEVDDSDELPVFKKCLLDDDGETNSVASSKLVDRSQSQPLPKLVPMAGPWAASRAEPMQQTKQSSNMMGLGFGGNCLLDDLMTHDKKEVNTLTAEQKIKKKVPSRSSKFF